MSSDCSWKCQWTGHTWWWWVARSREKGRHAQNNACQNLPGDNEVSSRDVYPQIVETSRVCRATVVMTSKVEPCHVEPCRPATRSCKLFCTQLAASVDLSILVLCGHISAVRRQCAQHYSGSVVAETLSIHWYHTEGCCNNPNGMSLLKLLLQYSLALLQLRKNVQVRKGSQGTLRVLNDYTSSYRILLDTVSKPTLYISRLKSIAIEAYKCYVNENPGYINIMLDPLNKPYDLRGSSRAEQSNVNTTSCGLNTFTYQAAKLWNILPSHIKEADSIYEFKSLLSKCNGPECHCDCCDLCNTYNVQMVSYWQFLNLHFSLFSNAVWIECLYGHFLLCDMYRFYGFYIDG